MTVPIPAALDALVALPSAYVEDEGHALFGVQVIDGQPLSNLEPDVFVVGFNPDRSAVSAQVTPLGLTANTTAFDIACLVSVLRGDEDAKAVRDRAFAMFDAIDALIRADTGLGGAVMDSRVEFVDFDQQQTTDGAVATVAFTVRAFA